MTACRPLAFGFAVALLGACAAPGASAPPQPFETADRCGYRAADGRVALAPRWRVCLPYTQGGIAAVADDAGWQWIDRTGAPVARAFVVDNGPDAFRDGLARFVGADGRIGFIDAAGRVAVPARFDAALPFAAGLAPACTGCRPVRDGAHAAWTGGRWGYIDRTGATRIAFRFDAAAPADPAAPGRLRVRRGACQTEIDPSGTIVGPPCP